MKILLLSEHYPPSHNMGSEVMLHDIAKYLISQSNEVKAILTKRKENSEHEGVQLFTLKEKVDLISWADVIFTHMDTAIIYGVARKKTVHFAHNDIFRYKIAGGDSNYNAIVYNTKGVAKALKYNVPSFILNPPCDKKFYTLAQTGTEREYITLINISKNKGVDLFYELAKRLPNMKFLGVKGCYTEQIVKHLPNVTIEEHAPDICKVYEKTLLLLCPSAFESWGRVAREAMAAGIPVIAHPAIGLVENCGGAAIYADRSNPRQWVEAIERLQEVTAYQKQSEAVKTYAKDNDTSYQLPEFERWLIKYVKN